jgi:HAD superfamily hydrolase (TIGR01509 family)
MADTSPSASAPIDMASAASSRLAMQQIFTYVFMTGYSPARMIRNVIFDAGGVLLEWNPPRVIAQLYPDPAIQAGIRQYIFEHPDWHEFDRGTITADSAPAHFAKLSGRTPDEVRELLRATAESLQPIPETIRLHEDLTAAGIHLYLLSNMPESTFEVLIQRHGFFAHFKQLVISGKILLLKPEPAIYKHLVDTTGIVPSESVFIDDLTRNVIAARESGLHAIQFTSPEACRAELRAMLPDIPL